MASDRLRSAYLEWANTQPPESTRWDTFAAGWDASLKPHANVKNAIPVVLFFSTKADADEFVAAVQELKPDLVGASVE